MTRYQQDTKQMKEYAKIKVKCKYCGHVNIMPVFVDKKPCGYCKKEIHNNTQTYFRYKLIKELRKVDKSELV